MGFVFYFLFSSLFLLAMGYGSSFSSFSLASFTRSSNYSMVRFNGSVGVRFSISSRTCSSLCLIGKWRALMPIRCSRCLFDDEGRKEGSFSKVRRVPKK